MKTIIIKRKTGNIIIEMGENDCPIEVMKEHGISETKYKFLKNPAKWQTKSK